MDFPSSTPTFATCLAIMESTEGKAENQVAFKVVLSIEDPKSDLNYGSQVFRINLNSSKMACMEGITS